MANKNRPRNRRQMTTTLEKIPLVSIASLNFINSLNSLNSLNPRELRGLWELRKNAGFA